MLEYRTGRDGGNAVVDDKPGGKGPRSRLNDEERDTILRLIHAIRVFKGMKSNLSVNHIEAFLQIAYEEGRSVRDLYTALGVAQSVASRHMLDLGPSMRHGEEGLGLVEHRMSPINMRTHEMRLSQKGLTVARNVAQLLLGGRRK